MNFKGISTDKKKLFEEIKSFKKKKTNSKFNFTSKRHKHSTLDSSIVSENSILIDNQPIGDLPSSLLFYKDLTNLRSSFNVAIIKAKKLMNKKITSTWQTNPRLDNDINNSLEECYKHVKVFEDTLK